MPVRLPSLFNDSPDAELSLRIVNVLGAQDPAPAGSDPCVVQAIQVPDSSGRWGLDSILGNRRSATRRCPVAEGTGLYRLRRCPRGALDGGHLIRHGAAFTGVADAALTARGSSEPVPGRVRSRRQPPPTNPEHSGR